MDSNKNIPATTTAERSKLVAESDVIIALAVLKKRHRQRADVKAKLLELFERQGAVR